MSQCSSQTESEPDDPLSAWDAADFQQMSAEITRIGRRSPTGQNGVVELTDALSLLNDMDICAVADDESLHETIREISGTILLYLDKLVGRSGDENWEETRLAFLALLDADFLSLLFKFRALFRAIAVSSTIGNSTSVIVCWADVIIAKLGQAVTTIAGSCFDASSSDQVYPKSVCAQREDDMLRAATQLPERWSDIMHVVISDYVSPAAYRLCLCLLFGANVMAPQLAGQNTVVGFAERDTLLHALQARLKRIVAKRNQGVGTLLDAGEQERMAYAMFVSLYALTEESDHVHLESPGRPQTHTVLLEMIQAVLRPESSLAPLSIMTPPPDVDTAIAILVKWGTTLPWAWRTWEDARLYNSEIAEHLTVTWLHNVDIHTNEVPLAHSVEFWDEDLVMALEVEPRVALSMMLRLLLCTLCAVKDAIPEQLPGSVVDVLLKTCWSTRYLLQIVDVDPTSLTALLGIIFNLFAFLSNGTSELGVNDLIIEIMSMSRTGLQGAFAAVSDPKSEFTMSLDRRLTRISRLCLDAESHGGMTIAELRYVNQTIQLLTLMWADGTSSHHIPHSIQRFFSALVAWMGHANTDSLAWRVLGDAFVGILAILEQRRSDPTIAAIDRCWDDLSVWRLVREANPSELPLASSLAVYVATTAHSRQCDGLLSAEAWDYFRDVLLLVLTSDYEGPDEPLALLIAPSVCRALLALLENAQGANRHYFISSPWTLCMTKYLKNLKESGDRDGEYAHILHERIGEQAKLICEGLASRLCPSAGTREVRWFRCLKRGNASDRLNRPACAI